jgi:hypothetical protein
MTKNIINIDEVELRPRPPEYAATGPAAQRFDRARRHDRQAHRR